MTNLHEAKHSLQKLFTSFDMQGKFFVDLLIRTLSNTITEKTHWSGKQWVITVEEHISAFGCARFSVSSDPFLWIPFSHIKWPYVLPRLAPLYSFFEPPACFMTIYKNLLQLILLRHWKKRQQPKKKTSIAIETKIKTFFFCCCLIWSSLHCSAHFSLMATFSPRRFYLHNTGVLTTHSV